MMLSALRTESDWADLDCHSGIDEHYRLIEYDAV
jgi:hypothetical protein